MKVVWSETSISQIRIYAKIIEGDKPKAAAKWINEIFSKEGDIAEFPLLGRVVPEYQKTSIREIIHGNFRIIYKIQDAEILVATVQNSKRLLGDSSDFV